MKASTKDKISDLDRRQDELIARLKSDMVKACDDIRAGSGQYKVPALITISVSHGG